MESDQSLSYWIEELKAGNEAAARVVWDHFFRRVADLARVRLGAGFRRAHDEEDVALSAIHALCIGARDGRFPRLDSAADLWQVLAMITCRKVANLHRQRHARAEVGESVLWTQADRSGATIDELVAGPISQQLVEEMSLVGRELLEQLEPKLRDTALMKLEGYTNAEIAARLQRSEKTIERYLKMIRELWDVV